MGTGGDIRCRIQGDAYGPALLSEPETDMTNHEIARIFSRIADALEIKGENIFRVRAYRTAAQNIKALARQLEDVYRETPEKIGQLQGIGKDLSAKIAELIATGGLEYYEDLMKEFPEGFLSMLDLAGLGPKKLKKLHDELGIDNIAQLEKACRENKLETLEGMGPKTEIKLLEAISYYRGSEGRMLLPEAGEYAGQIVGYLLSSGLFEKVEIAGSLRRGKETVGDLDILTVAKNTEKAMDHFISYPLVGAVIARGTTKSSIKIKEGPQVDLRAVEKKAFGAALVYFTGSQQHNIRIRHLARKKGYKVNEYGVFSVGPRGRERRLKASTEEEVYKKIGMQWVPPELRESSGEIEAALDGKIPSDLVKESDIKGDLHLHTSETDGRAGLEEVMSAAEERGYKYIAITDHSQNVRIANGMDKKRLLRHLERIRKAAEKFKGLEVLAGCEVDMLENGKLDFGDEVLRELDIVIAAVHSKFNLDRKKQTDRYLRAMDNRFVNIIAHPSGRLITSRKALDLDLEKVFRKAAENRVFLEVNTHGQRIDLNDVNCRRAVELGAGVAINTDAHEPAQMDLLKYGVITARRGWVEKKDVLNTYSLSKLKKALKK
ncbi:MAG: DNA polymerase/3'-5' exonuclease PolX [Candidatus Omnitrophica bacterium]|nr:DNA polymerase/3'-5' exonuclease PolX [Candidatus Omnitrophota bacterium]